MSDRYDDDTRAASKNLAKIVIPLVILVALLFIAGIVALIMSDDGGDRRERARMVTLLKPPPPPEIKEKPPEPEMKKEEIIEPEPEPDQDQPEDAPDDEGKSVDDLLGLDSDATGSDDFGLKAKKGGHSLVGGGDGRFHWYTAMIQKEISDTVRNYLEKNGGLPETELKALVKVVIDDTGKVVDYALLASSGDERMDRAIMKALATAAIEEMPPLDMPRALKFRITSKGRA
ncbi:hypothetical protein JCM14469_14520 [Desulfatiferula olefinivorans]